MRAIGQSDGVSVKAYAGTTGVILAFDVLPERRTGLLGFAIQRAGGNRPTKWLAGGLHFPGVDHRPGEFAASNSAPIQKFRWSDYTVFPDTSYTYTVHPVYGAPGALDLRSGPSVAVKTSSVERGDHRVVFNRAAAASQAFSREFPEVATEFALARKEKREPEPLPRKALAWLSRGALEQITGFCARALDPTWALDIAIYEYELQEIRDAIDAARDRGAEVRIVYHAKRDDPQTEINEANVADWPAAQKHARVTSRIFHDKFVVLSRIDGDRRAPRAVLCGSTNFTENGVYRQANVVHVSERPELAAKYLEIFELLFAGSTPAETKKWINANNQLGTDDPVVAGFSPRAGEVDLELFAAEIRGAERDVLFCTAFDLNQRILDALLGRPHDPILRFGLQNKPSEITGVHRDRTADFVATAMIDEGLEGYLKETTAGQRGNILIHTKLVVVDFTSDAPTVMSGSHNLSAAASGGNDENFLIIRGGIDVADCYGVELMRLYEHYRFRWHQSPRSATQPSRPEDPTWPEGTLAPDDRWSAPYFEDGALESADRRRFGAPPE
ncbi:MAG: phospholipase D-like domain-containing protein [Actinomycetota bacterium]|nr:phospholipase D-like domain-containing protein [Actinomycetota bacterium]